MREPYGEPNVDAMIPELREVIVANMFDGDDGGEVWGNVSDLADEMAEILAVWLVKG